LLQSLLLRSYAALVSVAAGIDGAKQAVYRNDARSAALPSKRLIEACQSRPKGTSHGRENNGN